MRAQVTTTTDAKGREWVHPERLSYYLYQDERTQLWYVMARGTDCSVTKDYKSKRGALAAFRRSWEKNRGRLPLYR